MSDAAYKRTLAGLKNAYDNKVPLTFSTDADYWVQGKTRGELCLEFVKTWIDAGIPSADTLRAMTVNGYSSARRRTRAGRSRRVFSPTSLRCPAIRSRISMRSKTCSS